MPSTISIWYGLSDIQIDPRTHFWYESTQELKNRLCDDLVTSGPIQEPHPKEPLLPCRDCEQLYVQDMTVGKRVFDYLPPAPTNATIHDNAPASGRERIVKEARTFLTDPRGYPQRSYYWALLNTLRQTHWNTHDLSDFEIALEETLERLPNTKGKESRKDHYHKIGQAYLKFWSEQQDAQFFKIPPTRIEIQGLTILVNPEVGLRRHGDELALKLWLSSPRPNRAFRQAIQHLMAEAQSQGWERHLQPALWDVRRKEILPNVRLARGFERVIRSQAAAFRVHWDALGTEEEVQVN